MHENLSIAVETAVEEGDLETLLDMSEAVIGNDDLKRPNRAWATSLVQSAAKAKNANWCAWAYNYWVLSNIFPKDVSKHIIYFEVGSFNKYTSAYIEIMVQIGKKAKHTAFVCKDGGGYLSFSNSLNSGNKQVIEYIMSQLIAANSSINTVITYNKLELPSLAFEMLKGQPHHIIKMYDEQVRLHSKYYYGYTMSRLFKSLLVHECIRYALKKDLVIRAIEVYMQLGIDIEANCYEFLYNEHGEQSVKQQLALIDRLVNQYVNAILSSGDAEKIKKFMQDENNETKKIKALLGNNNITDEFKTYLLSEEDCKLSKAAKEDIMKHAILSNNKKLMQLVFGLYESKESKVKIFAYACWLYGASIQAISTLWYDGISEDYRKIFLDAKFWESQERSTCFDPLLVHLCIRYISEKQVPGSEYYGNKQQFKLTQDLLKAHRERVFSSGDEEKIKKLVQYENYEDTMIKALLGNNDTTDEFKLALLTQFRDKNCKLSKAVKREIMKHAILGNNKKFMQFAFELYKSNKSKGRIFAYACWLCDASIQAISTLWHDGISEDYRKIFLDAKFWESQEKGLIFDPLLAYLCIRYISEKDVPGSEYYGNKQQFKLTQDLPKEHAERVFSSGDEEKIKKLMQYDNGEDPKIEELLANKNVTDEFKQSLLSDKDCKLTDWHKKQVMSFSILHDNKKFIHFAFGFFQSDETKGAILKHACSLYGASFKTIRTLLHEVLSENDRLAFLGAQPWDQRLILNRPIIDILAFVHLKNSYIVVGVVKIALLAVSIGVMGDIIDTNNDLSIVSRTALLAVMAPVTAVAFVAFISGVRLQPKMLRTELVDNTPAVPGYY